MGAAENKAKTFALLESLGNGSLLAKWDDFYDPNVTMRENGLLDPARTGREANLKHETFFFTNAKFLGFELGPVIAEGDHVAFGSKMSMEFLGQRMDREQWTVQTWKDGRIVDEAFYYKA